MRATFQNSAQVLSIGLFFSLMVVGLASTLPSTMTAGLTAHGVSHATATKLAHLPPVGLLFAAFLGYNPIQKLLGPETLSHLTHAQAHTLTGRSFFPNLISGPFIDAMAIVFVAALVMSLIAAVASWSRGKDPVVSDDETGPSGAPESAGVEALDATPLAEAWTSA
jgi:hypothetical protein